MMYRLTYHELRRLHQRAYFAQQPNHLEVCGVISSDADGFIRFHFTANRSDRPGAFSIAKVDLTQANRSARQNGLRPVGLFHSHPISGPTLGRRDLLLSPLRRLHLVYDVCSLRPKLWRVTKKGKKRIATEIPLLVCRTSSNTN